EYNAVTGGSDWSSTFGYPCNIGSVSFGEVEHAYIQASNAAHFYREGWYDYWILRSRITGVMESDGESDDFISGVELNGTFRFNPIIGTYTWDGQYGFWFFRKKARVFYQPDNNGTGYGRLVYGDILEKLKTAHYNPKLYYCVSDNEHCGQANWILSEIGFPVGNRKNTQESLADTRGEYQSFIGGQVYEATYTRTNRLSAWNKTFYLPARIADYYKSPAVGGDGMQGVGGRYGFPISDPYIEENENIVRQDFEQEAIEVIYDEVADTYDVGSVALHAIVRRKQNMVYASEQLDDVIEGVITDAEAFANIVDDVAKRTSNNDDFVNDLLILLVGTDDLNLRTIIKIMNKAPLVNFETDYYSFFRVDEFSDTGFKMIYNDSHYCMSYNKYKKDYECISNQLFHSMAGLVLGYFYPRSFADLSSFIHEHERGVVPTFGYKGYSYEDLYLGIKMSELGEGLRLGTINKENADDWIRTNIMRANVSSLRKAEDKIRALDPYKKRFRVFEYVSNVYLYGQSRLYGQPRWMLSDDVKKYICSDNEVLYYQDYSHFYFDGVMRSPAKAIWRDDTKKMLFIYDEVLNQYNGMNQICGNLEELTNIFEFEINMEFIELVDMY
ncbi:hypothetical protein HQ544_02100, partial [Candidatus Falkowbacteria bacterium]|nr:hypothetical protein [Candidatus Falkowbacteria bacterium]